VSCAKTAQPIEMQFGMQKATPFAGRDDCTCVKILVALIFLIAINFLTR